MKPLTKEDVYDKCPKTFTASSVLEAKEWLHNALNEHNKKRGLTVRNMKCIRNLIDEAFNIDKELNHW